MSDGGYQHLSQILGSLIACAGGFLDAWYFHAFPIEVSGALIAAGLVGFGLKSAGIPPAPAPR